MVKAIYSPSGQGTLDFMAAEVLNEAYMVIPQPTVDTEIITVDDEDTEVIPSPSFEHNHGHDVESLFWIALFILFFYRDVSSPEEDEAQEKERRSCSAFVFPGNILQSKSNRYRVIFVQTVFKDHVQWFCRSFKQLVVPLSKLVNAFNYAYTSFERTMGKNKDPGIFSIVHKYAIAVFESCEKKAENITIQSYKGRQTEGVLQSPELSATP